MSHIMVARTNQTVLIQSVVFTRWRNNISHLSCVYLRRDDGFSPVPMNHVGPADSESIPRALYLTCESVMTSKSWSASQTQVPWVFEARLARLKILRPPQACKPRDRHSTGALSKGPRTLLHNPGMAPHYAYIQSRPHWCPQLK